MHNSGPCDNKLPVKGKTPPSDKARFVVGKNAEIVDTKKTPKGSYVHPDGSRTDVLQEKSHYNKRTGEGHGHSHTHETYTNVDKDGKIRTGVDNHKTHRVKYEEVKNIESGRAVKVR